MQPRGGNEPTCVGLTTGAFCARCPADPQTTRPGTLPHAEPNPVSKSWCHYCITTKLQLAPLLRDANFIQKKGTRGVRARVRQQRHSELVRISFSNRVRKHLTRNQRVDNMTSSRRGFACFPSSSSSSFFLFWPVALRHQSIKHGSSA